MKKGIALLEEATHRLRLLPVSCFAIYYAGALPFALAVLWFWADMSRSAFAEARLAGAAFGVAVAWLWMQAMKSAFSADVLARVRGEAPPAWSARGAARVALRTAAVDPSGLFVIPIAAALVLPFAWVFAFYAHASVGRREAGSLGQSLRAALQEARRGPGENHFALGLLLLVGIIVFANVLALLWFLPELLHMLTGFESDVLIGGWDPRNSTVLAVAGAATYLLVDPLARVAYALRTFYGEAETSGRDLEVELRQAEERRVREGRGRAVAAGLLLACVLFPREALAAPGPVRGPPVPLGSAAPPPQVDPHALGEALDRVLERPEFTWRLPRDARVVAPEERSWLNDVADWVRARLQDAGRLMGRVVKWLFGLGGGRPSPDPSGGGLSFEDAATPVLAILAAVSLALAVVVAIRRARRARPAALELAAAALPAPDLDDPRLSPDRLPPDEWARLAQKLLSSGEARLALRALFLEVLALLGQAGLVSPRPHKSVADYEREIERRRATLPALVAPFEENARLFEGAWYGARPVTDDILRRFIDNARRIKDGAQA